MKARRELRVALALAAIEVVRAPEVPTRCHHRDRRRRDQRDRREPHVEQQERADRKRHFEHGEHRDRDGPPHRVGEHRHVARDAADEITGARAFHEVDRDAERVVEHLGTQFRQRALADDRGAHAAPVPEPGGEEREERVADRGPVDDPRRVGAAVRDRVHDDPDESGTGQRGRGRATREQHRADDARPARAKEPQRARPRFARRRRREGAVVDDRGHAVVVSASGATERDSARRA